jgi:hypothetical protein
MIFANMFETIYAVAGSYVVMNEGIRLIKLFAKRIRGD